MRFSLFYNFDILPGKEVPELYRFEGKYYQYKGVDIHPRPVQNARQLLWLAAGNGTPEVAGQIGCQILVPRVGPVSRHQKIISRYQNTLGVKSGFVSVLRFVYAAETEREAQEQTRRTITCGTLYATWQRGTWSRQGCRRERRSDCRKHGSKWL
ncbi:LLM class flavin-dependent oxidoreductase [Dictyobacter vulcani]|uniref:LLM class flavin-dependent oxidoreductase n=1 Tax=Dictyobacter vulcani TaxID=2607529 RepID=UPI00124FDC4D|nr:LLM class flavin-dependent oxidoreductase [Dictyobacter vulcani]